MEWINLLSHFSVNKPYTVIVILVIVAILGVISVVNITTDLLPNINLPYAVVLTIYPGASPEAIELQISRLVEQSMLTLSDIKNVLSISAENLSLVILEFNELANMDSAIIEMREKLDMIVSFMPNEITNPMIMRINPDMLPVSVLSAAVEGQSIAEASHFMENVIIPEYESIAGVGSVAATGLVDREIHVTLNQEKIDAEKTRIQDVFSSAMLLPSIFMRGMDITSMLDDLGINVDQIQDLEVTKEMIGGIIQGQNYGMPAGYIYQNGAPCLVRVGDPIKSFEELKSLPIISLPFPNFTPITLESITDIELKDNSEKTYARINGNEAVALILQKQTDYSTTDVAKSIRNRSKDLMDQYENLKITSLMDQGVYIDTVLNSLVRNIIYGGILALVILFIFLKDIKPTIVVACAIPISIVTTFVLMYFSNITLNIISMGGLALGIGMLVDNSIVVIENIYRMHNSGKSAREAAIEGAKQVAGAIAASTLTTIAVFFPIVFTQGLTRQVFSDMGLTIAYSLGASLLVALTLVPMIASRLLDKKPKEESKVLGRIKTGYSRLLELALNKKWIVLIIVSALLVVSIIGALSMGTEFIPTPDTNELSVQVTLPAGISFTDATETADLITEVIGEIDDVETIGVFLGDYILSMGMGVGTENVDHESVSFYLLLNEDRKHTSSQIAQQIRNRIEKENLDAEIIVNESNVDLSAISGGAIVLKIKGREFDVIQTIAQDTAEIIAGIEGTVEVSDGLEETAPELRIVVDKSKSIAQGLTVGQVLMTLGEELNSNKAITTLTEGDDEYQVFVKDQKDLRTRTLDYLDELSLESPFGNPVKLSEIATIEQAQGFTTIQRENQQRYVSVTADVAAGYNIGNISREIDQQLADYQLPEGYTIEYGGEHSIILESFSDLILVLVVGVIFIYLIMVAQFQSLLSPFIVMFTIPLAFTGGFIGLIVTGNPISIVAFLGLIILSGVVVNNGIVFVDYINILRQSGLSKREAISQAGVVRLRPILMTALTTIIALSTMSLGVGMGTEMIQPMAISATSGLIYATLLTLFVVPILYDIFNKE